MSFRVINKFLARFFLERSNNFGRPLSYGCTINWITYAQPD